MLNPEQIKYIDTLKLSYPNLSDIDLQNTLKTANWNEEMIVESLSRYKSTSEIKTSTINQAEEKTPNIIIILILLSWVAYLPIAFFILAISAMAGDSGKISFGVGLLVLVVNIIPVFIMFYMTWKAFTKRSKMYAILPIPMIMVSGLFFQILLFIISLIATVYISQKPVKILPATETRLICPDGSFMTIYSTYIAYTHNPKNEGYVNVGEIKKGKLFLINSPPIYRVREAISECKNIENKSVLDLYEIIYPN